MLQTKDVYECCIHSDIIWTYFLHIWNLSSSSHMDMHILRLALVHIAHFHFLLHCPLSGTHLTQQQKPHILFIVINLMDELLLVLSCLLKQWKTTSPFCHPNCLLYEIIEQLSSMRFALANTLIHRYHLESRFGVLILQKFISFTFWITQPMQMTHVRNSSIYFDQSYR